MHWIACGTMTKRRERGEGRAGARDEGADRGSGQRRLGEREVQTREAFLFHCWNVRLIELQGFGADQVRGEMREDEVSPENEVVHFVHWSISERARDNCALILIEAMYRQTKENFQILRGEVKSSRL
jgi:hypothetical protein